MSRKRHGARLIPTPVQEWGGRLPVALVFPNKPALAYSSLGWQAVWRLLQPSKALAVEPVFWDPDRGTILQADRGRGLQCFGVVAFSLTYEFDFLHAVRILMAAGMAPRTDQRSTWPLVMAGGALAFLNPAPIAPSVDLFWIGEGEAGLIQCMEGLARDYVRGASKETALANAAGQAGVYVPQADQGTVRRVVDMAGAQGARLASPVVSSFTSQGAVFRDTLLLEVNRGCPHGCRFCAAGYIYRPHRQAAINDLRSLVLHHQPRKVGLVGTALTDWPDLCEFLQWLHARNVDVSLSSLRLDGLTDPLLDTMRQLGMRTVTLALEGASQRLRDSMNKHVQADGFLRCVEKLAVKGFNHLKVYLLTGWPGESDADWRECELLLAEMQQARFAARGRGSGLELITLSMGCLVPKPWTPLQWSAMADEMLFRRRIADARKMARRMTGVQVRSDSPWLARIQGLLARGDAQVHDLIRGAAQSTGRNMDIWSEALQGWAGEAGWYLDRERDRGEEFPWEVISQGVRREYLWSEWEKARLARLTAPCQTGMGTDRLGCESCDRCGLDGWLQT